MRIFMPNFLTMAPSLFIWAQLALTASTVWGGRGPRPGPPRGGGASVPELAGEFPARRGLFGPPEPLRVPSGPPAWPGAPAPGGPPGGGPPGPPRPRPPRPAG